jgi:hypothetical protein
MTAGCSGDEPGLGGHSDDNSPMISSVQTRAIVSARGAYTVGNLDALIELMTERQKTSFRITLIAHAFSYAKTTILQYPGEEYRYPVLYDLAQQVDKWLQHPASLDVSMLEISLNFTVEDQYIVGEEALYDLLQAVVDLYTDQSNHAVLRTTFLMYPFYLYPPMPDELLELVIHQWHLDLAWSLLTRAARPPAPVIDGTGILRLPQVELSKRYESGDLAGLTQMMTHSRMAEFRTLILTVMLEHTRQIKFPHSWRSVERMWLDTFAHWLWEFDRPTAQEYYDFTTAMNRLQGGNDYHLRAIATAGRSLRLLSRDETLFIKNCYYGAGSTARASGYALAANAQAEPGAVAERITAAIHKWHLDVVWAILHDEPIPPLELAP